MVKILHRFEYGIAFLLLLFVYFHLDFPFWLFLLLLFVPDVTLVGYLVNQKVGSILYNMGHNLMIPLVLLGVALLFDSQLLLVIACIWLAHISMDRFLGYGLKYKDSFKDTHMQKV